MKKARLQKVLSEAGVCSRRQAEVLLSQKRITINGSTAVLGDQINRELDEIKIDGNTVQLKNPPKVILLNKPKNIISSCNDPLGRKTVLDLLPPEIRQGLYPVGRLDYLSRGALLITNHGDLTLKLTHPRYSHPKSYLVWVKGIASEHVLQKWREGVFLDGEKTLRAKVTKIKERNNNSLIKIILREGRNRQIRRTADIFGHPVLDLQRISVSGLSINSLDEGDWKEIDQKDWRKLLSKSTTQEVI